MWFLFLGINNGFRACFGGNSMHRSHGSLHVLTGQWRIWGRATLESLTACHELAEDSLK